MEAFQPKRSSYVQFAVQAVILIMLAVLLGYIYIQDDRLNELEKRMATTSLKAERSKLLVIKALHTFLKRSEELEAIDSRLGIVEIKVNELQIELESQSMEQELGKMGDNLEKIREKFENTDKMLQKLKGSLADICNRDKSAVSSQQTLRAQLDEIVTEIQTNAKTLNQRESDLKHLTGKTIKMKSFQSSAINNLEETRKDVQELIRSRKDVLDVHSKTVEIEKGNIQDVRQHITASQSCQTGIVALDQPVPSYDERLLRVQFGTPFSSPPVISYGIVKLDTSALPNSRVGVSLLDQSTTGFTVSFTTWSGNIVYDCSISWMACART